MNVLPKATKKVASPDDKPVGRISKKRADQIRKGAIFVPPKKRKLSPGLAAIKKAFDKGRPRCPACKSLSVYTRWRVGEHRCIRCGKVWPMKGGNKR